MNPAGDCHYFQTIFPSSLLNNQHKLLWTSCQFHEKSGSKLTNEQILDPASKFHLTFTQIETGNAHQTKKQRFIFLSRCERSTWHGSDVCCFFERECVLNKKKNTSRAPSAGRTEILHERAYQCQRVNNSVCCFLIGR
jgi:hypothetical protein